MYDTNVFINCPFDKEYKSIFDAITFTIHDAGFKARTALEETGTGPDRIDKIVKIIKDCRLGIHDVSRVETTPTGTLPRFNMPFECGLFFGAMYFGSTVQRRKELLVLDGELHRYKKTMSDIAGKDADCHHNDPIKAIQCVRKFLSGKANQDLPGAAFFKKRFEEFAKDLPLIAAKGKIAVDEFTSLDYWPELVNAMILWQQNHPR